MLSAKHYAALILLAAIWGASFLFMRIAAPEFGAIPLIGLRVSIAALILLPVMVARGCFSQTKGQLTTLSILGLTNAAIPFSLFAFATLSLSAGFTSVLNSLAPMFTAVVGFIWLRHRLTFLSTIGLLTGVIGVAILVQDTGQINSAAQWQAVAAAIFATLLYGFAANFAKQHKGAMSPLTVTGGHLIAASVFLAPLSVAFWPQEPPSQMAWLTTIGLAVLCTGIAHLIYFWLLQQVSAHAAVSVTFMIPMFGMFWGFLVANESVTMEMILGSVVILLGVALTTGLVGKKPNSAK